jgi:hypothetical protein
MFHKEHSDKKNIFVNNIKLDKVDKKKESKTEVRGGHATPTRSTPKGRFAPPHVNTKISAYDRVVQLVTNDSSEIKPPQEEQKKRVHMSV